MPRECEVWEVLGYSIVHSDDPNKPRHQEARRLKEIFGEFITIRFQILRFGPEAFELTIRRIVHRELPEIKDTVAGLVGDPMILQGGEQVRFVRFSQDSGQLLMRFWKGD